MPQQHLAEEDSSGDRNVNNNQIKSCIIHEIT